jgi:hypothetical protein
MEWDNKINSLSGYKQNIAKKNIELYSKKTIIIYRVIKDRKGL